MPVLSDTQFAAVANRPAYPGASEGGASRNVHTGDAVVVGKTPGYAVSYKGPHERSANLVGGRVQASEAGEHLQQMRSDPSVSSDKNALQGVWHERIGQPNASATFDRSTLVSGPSALRRATSLGRRQRQDAIFRPRTGESIQLPQGRMKAAMDAPSTAGAHRDAAFFPAQKTALRRVS